MNKIIQNPGSYRDPAGSVYNYNGRIIRTVKNYGLKRYEYIKNNNILDSSIKNNFLIKTKEVNELKKEPEFSDAHHVLEHEVIPYVSYPYEWGFYQLKTAALHHLEFQIFLLEKNSVLIDASAYNIQFIGNKPIFIDVLSIDKYEEGDFWIGHSQFLEQFLNPLLLRSKKDIIFNNWYKGNVEGISTSDLNSLLNFSDKFSLNIFMQVVMLSRLNKKVITDPKKITNKLIKKKISKKSYLGILIQLRNWINKLKPKSKNTVWENYENDNSYSDNGRQTKIEIIKNFSNKFKPKIIADLGCNDGLFSFESLKSGAKYAVGFDFDINAIDLAFNNSIKDDRNFLPLYFDVSNPSTNLGFNENERESFNKRLNFDAIIALAFIHHLAIAKNIPLNRAIDWLINIAPVGLIEFVPKDDTTIQQMISLKGDIFPQYNEDNFMKLIQQKAQVLNVSKIKDSGRKIIEFKRY
tara:strand:+ start:472 stop:1866 length:1395 start_codon:yes stop_codon:yes gene_type:complete